MIWYSLSLALVVFYVFWRLFRQETIERSAKTTVLVGGTRSGDSFLEEPGERVGEGVAAGDRWSYNGCLRIPQEQLGVSEIYFTTPRDPRHCRRLAEESPTARFFSYWHETGSCHLHETLPAGEKVPEAMSKYLYALPNQHWLSGYVDKPKAGLPANF